MSKMFEHHPKRIANRKPRHATLFWKSKKKAQDFDLVHILPQKEGNQKWWDQVVFVNILLHTQGQGCDESICDLGGHVGTKAMKN